MQDLPDFLNCAPLGPTTITNNTRLSIHVCYSICLNLSAQICCWGEGRVIQISSDMDD